MSDNNNGKRRAVYTVIDSTSDSRKARWLRIGICFENRDGSLNLLLDALPVNGRLHVRDFPPPDSSEEGAGAGGGEPYERSRPQRAAA